MGNVHSSWTALLAFPQLNDLGEAVEIPVTNMGFAAPRVCSPEAFRTPETILGRPFNEKTDVWMVGCLSLDCRHQLSSSSDNSMGPD
jgi:hypothetical protein